MPLEKAVSEAVEWYRGVDGKCHKKFSEQKNSFLGFELNREK
jgi:hypothetical protein